MMARTLKVIWSAIAVMLFAFPVLAHSEDGYDLWLRYRPVAPERNSELTRNFVAISAPENPSETTKAAVDELQRAFTGMTGDPLRATNTGGGGTILIGTPKMSDAVAALDLPLKSLGTEGYIVRSISGEKPMTVVAANSDLGTLYGTFALLRHIQSGKDTSKIDIISTPKIQLRLLNH